MTTIKPGVIINGTTYYPSGFLWLMAFASCGCQWAIDALQKQEAMLQYEYEMSDYPNVKDFVLLEKADTSNPTTTTEVIL